MQHLLSIPLLGAGLEPGQVGGWLAWVSTAAFGVMLAAMVRVLCKRSRFAAWIAALIILTGPFLWYARRSFGEMLAASLAVLAVSALLVRGPPAGVALAALAASLTKETAPVFVSVVLLWAAWEKRRADGDDSWGPLRPQLIGGAVGVLSGGMLLLAANELRFGTWYNVPYATEASYAPPLPAVIQQFAGLWLAPTGGLVLFWPSFIIVFAALSIGVFLRPGRPADRITVAAGWAILLALQMGLARWWGPFGWWAWGPRLTLPWIPPLLLISLYAQAETLERMARRPGSRLRWAAVTGASGLFAAYSMAIAADPGRVNRHFAVISAANKCGTPRIVPVAMYSDCSVKYMWSDWSLWLEPLRAMMLPRVLAITLSYAVAVGLLVWTLRGSLSRAGSGES